MIVTPSGEQAGYETLYEPGVKLAWNERPATMVHTWDAAVAATPDQQVVRYFSRAYTYAEVDARAVSVAAWFAEQGATHGSRVAILLQNVPEFVIAVVAAWKLGSVPVPINPAYRGVELGRILADAAPAVIATDARDADAVGHAASAAGVAAALLLADHGRDTAAPPQPQPGHASFDAVTARSGAKVPAFTPAADDLALLMYTSGTTGQPKGAMLTHGAIASNARLTAAWMRHSPTSLVLAVAPLFHITGFVSHLCGVVDARSTVLLPYRMMADAVLGLIRAHRPTHTICAITALSAFMNDPTATRDDFVSFERVYSGGAPIAPALRARIADRLGIVIYPGFGMTETSAPTHYAPFGSEVPVDPGSGALAIGVPTPGTDAMIADEHGLPLDTDVPGEMLVRGPQVMCGYRGRPEDTAAALAGGWMHTGDIAIRDAAGWFYIVDRKKDVIIASGFKVWPREVEDCLYLHPAVREAAVIGVADDYRGETVKAVISLHDHACAASDEIIAHCRAHLSGYKVPRVVEIVAELPKTVTGKIQRTAVRAGQ